MLLFKILKFILPFIKELIFGKKNINVVISTNPKLFILSSVCIVTFFFGIMTTYAAIKIGEELVSTKKKLTEISERTLNMECVNQEEAINKILEEIERLRENLPNKK